MIYTLEIKQLSVICHEGRMKGARLIAHGSGMEFYVIGSIDKRVDKVMNVIANKAIEMVGTAKNIHTVRGERAVKAIDPRQLKLL